MSRLLRPIVFSLFAIFVWIGAGRAEEFLQVVPGKKLEFPRDHGAHPEYPTEWWYFTGHLFEQSGRSFGFELTFFRIGVQRGERESAWHVPSLYMAHFALTDDKEKKFYHEKALSRPTMGKAGSKQTHLEVWLRDWKAGMKEEKVFLSAQARDEKTSAPFTLSLELFPKKNVVLHGDDGFSQKGSEPGEASYYMSYTRLEGSGRVVVEGKSYSVQSSAWMDHEVISYSAGSQKLGWDWFAVQLDSGEELMFFHLRDKQKGLSPYSSGTFVNADGSYEKLFANQFSIEAVDSWRSPHTGITYPSTWKVSIPSRKLNLTIAPTVRDQELASGRASGRSYWEGRCSVNGTKEKDSLSGNAYVELVGYH